MTDMRLAIDLAGPDGNAYVLMARTQTALAIMGRTPEEIEAVLADMRSADYPHLLDVLEREVGQMIRLVNRPRPATTP